MQIGDLNLTGAKIDSFRSAIWFRSAIPILNPNPIPNPSRSEPNNFSLLGRRPEPVIFLFKNKKCVIKPYIFSFT